MRRRFSEEEVHDMLRLRFGHGLAWQIAKRYADRLGDDHTIVYRITLPQGAKDARYEKYRQDYFAGRGPQPTFGLVPRRDEPATIDGVRPSSFEAMDPKNVPPATTKAEGLSWNEYKDYYL